VRLANLIAAIVLDEKRAIRRKNLPEEIVN
jgi:hypothetical protein